MAIKFLFLSLILRAILYSRFQNHVFRTLVRLEILSLIIILHILVILTGTQSILGALTLLVFSVGEAVLGLRLITKVIRRIKNELIIAQL